MNGPEIRDIPGFIGYGASSDGRIWSRWKWGRNELTCSWREIAQRRKTNSEYRLAQIGPTKGQKTCQVHRLVFLAWFGPIEDGMQINHKDGDKSNNDISNLEKTTPLENVMHAISMGLFPMGETHGNSILKHSDVVEIKAALQRGDTTQKAMAKRFGVSHITISAIKNGRLWKHV